MVVQAFIQMVAARVFNELVDVALDRLIDASEGSTRAILGAIDQLDDKIELQMASSLKAGITFVRLGMYDQALNEFVRAEASDPFCPIAKCWLAALAAGSRG